ncbi:MAG: S9 family peptidase [Endozoicomonadaceae bacterium]|nr:S9 family peptidase [Endozoicomonadaceae bacterium]
MRPPFAKKKPYILEMHDHRRIDNYYWLRDDSRKDQEVLSWLKAENDYVKHVMAPYAELQESLYLELTGRIKKDDSTVPVLERGYWYYTRYSGDNEYPIHARKAATLENEEYILLDGNHLAEGHKFFSIGDMDISLDNRLMAWSEDTVGRRIYSVYFKNLETGELLNDRLSQTTGDVMWAADHKTVFYIRQDPQTLLGYQVFRHTLGTDQAKDALVYEELDKRFYTGIDRTRDDTTLLITHNSTTQSAVSLLDSITPEGEFVPFLTREAEHEYDIAKLDDWYYIRTNWQATNFRLMKVHKDHTIEKSNWQEVIPHRDSVYLEDYLLFRDALILNEKENGIPRIRVIQPSTGKEHQLSFDDSAFVAHFSDNPNIDAARVRIWYSSMTTPDTIYEYDLLTSKRELLKQREIPGGFNPAEYSSERTFITASDGTGIPVSLVWRNDRFQKDGTNPLYQYGYGAYGYTIEPYFSASRLSLLDRGFIYAIAHVRGGQMLGRPWYEAGRQQQKLNSFTDFIDVTRALVTRQYADKNKVFASGDSAGGLLMGVVVNMAPELYLGVNTDVPFVDVVTSMLDESLPLTTNEYDEWGNPNNKIDYDYILSYSPYDNVKQQKYPNMLVTTGLHDSQVQYFEPAKWVAKLREYKTDENKLLLYTNMDAGHGGASGRYQQQKELALEYAFFLSLLN